jgi:hypothetical protein
VAKKVTAALVKTTVPLALRKDEQPYQGHNQRRPKHNLGRTPTVNATGSRDQATVKVVNAKVVNAKVAIAKVASVAVERSKNLRSWKKLGLASLIMTSRTTSLWPSVKGRCCCAAWSQNQEANLC